MTRPQTWAHAVHDDLTGACWRYLGTWPRCVHDYTVSVLKEGMPEDDAVTRQQSQLYR